MSTNSGFVTVNPIMFASLEHDNNINNLTLWGTSIHHDDHSHIVRSYLLLLLLLLSFIGLAGNSLIIYAIYRYQFLRKPCNYLLGSLAAADILVCGVLMPTAVAAMLLDFNAGTWRLGMASCKAFVCFEIVLTNATIWNISLVALDRYFAITKAVWYAPRRNVNNVVIAIVISWISSATLSVPTLFFPIGEPLNSSLNSQLYLCIPEKNAFYIISTAVSFYIPCALMITLYGFIYRAIRQLPNRAAATLVKGLCQTSQSYSSHIPPVISVCKIQNNEEIKLGELDKSNVFLSKSRLTAIASYSGDGSNKVMVRERRATKILAAILCTFILCWMPFFSFLTIHGIVHDLPFDTMTFHIVHWCGWCNSIFNPFLYASIKGDFKRAFKRIWSRGR